MRVTDQKSEHRSKLCTSEERLASRDVNTYRILLAIPAQGVAFAIGLFLYGKFATRNVADPGTLTTDPLLKKLQLLNPELRIVDVFGREPVYWIKTPGTQEGILFPKSEAEGARIRLRECNLAEIPPQLV
jgi:hypothetical protein